MSLRVSSAACILAWLTPFAAAQDTTQVGSQTGSQSEASPTAAPSTGITPRLLVDHPAQIGGDRLAWRAALIAALKADPTGPLAEATFRILRQHQSGDRTVQDLVEEGEQLRGFQAQLAGAPGSLHVAMGLHANARARRYGSSPADLSEDLYGEFLNAWYVVGPLGALDERMPATAPAPDLAARFPGEAPARFSPEGGSGDRAMPQSFLAADGAERSWVPIERYSNQVSARWSAQVFPGGGQTYALAFVKTQAGHDAGPLTLEIRTNDPVRAWWNDDLTIDEPRLNPYEKATVLRARVVPHADGWNAILLRVSTDERTPLCVRFLDEMGRSLAMEQPALDTAEMPRLRSGPASAPGAGSAMAKRLPSVLETWTEAVADGPFAAALRMFHANHLGRPDLALAEPRPVDVEPAAQHAWLRQRLEALERSKHLPQELQRREILTIVAELRAADAMCDSAYSSEVRRLLREDKPVEALAVCDEWSAVNPSLVAPKRWRVSALGRVDRTGTLAALAVVKLLEQHPHHPALRMHWMSRLTREDVRPAAIRHAWAALMADATDEDSLDFLVAAFTQSGDERLPELLASAQAWDKQHPTAARRSGAVTDILKGLGRRAQLVELSEAGATAHPLVPHAWWTLANHRLSVGDEAGALEALQRELALRPHDETSRQLRARLVDKDPGQPSDPAEAFFLEFSPDTAAALTLAKDESREAASVVEALDSGMIYFYGDGTAHGRYQALTMPLDRSGAETLNAIPVVDGTRRIRILKRDGRIQEPVHVNDEWVLPALEVGDVVDTIWDRIEEGTAGSPPENQLWRFASFDRAFPTSRWVLFIPHGLPGRLLLQHFDGSHETIEREDGTVHVMTTSNPQFIAEPLQPTEIEVLPVATLGDDRDRADELRSWWRYAVRNTAIPADLESGLSEFIATSTQGIDAADVRARAEALYVAVDGYLQSFEGEEGAANVWLTEKGWPAFLLGALYERAGVPFEWAVLESQVSPELDSPSRFVFDGVLSLAQAVLRLGIQDEAGDPIWIIHAGARGTPFGAITDGMVGVQAYVLESNEGGARKEHLPRTQSGEHWNLNLELTYMLQPDGGAEVKGRIVDRSPQGMMLIKQIREATAEQREGFAKAQAARMSPGVDLAEAGVILDGSEGKGMVLLFHGMAKEFAQPRGDEHVAAIPFIPLQLDKSFGPAERHWPVAARQAARVRAQIKVVPGEAWSLLESAPSVGEQRQGFEVALTITDDANGNRTYVQRYEIRGMLLEAAEMPAFLARMGEIEAETRRPLRLTRR